MSGDEVCRVWCLIDDEQTAFSVNASLKWDMEELTDAIQQRRPRLKTMDIIDLVLWKLNDPIPVPDDDTPPQLLSKLITGFSVKLNKRTQKLSDALPYLPEDHLHIIVKLPVDNPAEGPPLKKFRLGDRSEEALNSFRDFRNYYWGENRIKVRTEGGERFPTLDLTPTTADLSELNYRSVETLIIRDEYELAYDAILKAITKMELESRVVFIFTGQPGTGKTLFLFVLLVLRLQKKQAVALQINVDEFVLFKEDGVTKHGQYDRFAIPKGTWTLSDSESLGPCPAFRFSKGHIICTSPPASGRWKGWAEQFGAMEYVLDVWSLAEFRRLLTIFNYDIPSGETLFLRYGSDIRCIMDVLNHPEAEGAYIWDVKSGASEIAREFSTALLADLQGLNFQSNLSSKIFTVRPKNSVDRLGVLTIPTAYLFKTLAVAVARQEMAQQHYIFTTLTKHPSLGSAAGWLFENYAHVRLSDPTRQPIPTRTRGASNSSPIPVPKVMLSGSTALRNIQRPFNFYCRLREPNFEGLDSLIRVGNTVRVQQFTTSSSHRSATKGLDEVYKIMNHIRGLDWHFDIVGPDLSLAESARDSHDPKLTGRWAKMPIYASQLQFGILDKQTLERVLNEATDDTYPEYSMDSMSGFQISSSSTPVRVPSGLTTGHEEMGSTSAPDHQAARVSTRRKPSQKQSSTLSTDTVVPRRSPRSQK